MKILCGACMQPMKKGDSGWYHCFVCKRQIKVVN